MSEDAIDDLDAVPGRCIARTHAGKRCGAPPLVGGSYCFIHDPRPDLAAARDAARGKGVKRSRDRMPSASCPTVEQLAKCDVATVEGIQEFRRGLMVRVL